MPGEGPFLKLLQGLKRGWVAPSSLPSWDPPAAYNRPNCSLGRGSDCPAPREGDSRKILRFTCDPHGPVPQRDPPKLRRKWNGGILEGGLHELGGGDGKVVSMWWVRDEVFPFDSPPRTQRKPSPQLGEWG